MSITKDHLSVAVLGKPATGKSALVGYIVNAIGTSGLCDDELCNQGAAAGDTALALAKIVESHETRRPSVGTAGVSYWPIETSSQTCTLLDTPGHIDYINNLVVAVSQSDVVILVIDATAVSADRSGIGDHISLVKAFGVNYVIIVVNKLDAVTHPQKVFEECVTECDKEFKRASKGLGGATKVVIPISVAEGANILQHYCEWSSWYPGDTLIGALSHTPPITRQLNGPLRVPIQDVLRVSGIGTVLLGRVASGQMHCGMRVVLQPRGIVTEVRSLEIHEQAVESAVVGDLVGICIQGVGASDVCRGEVLMAHGPSMVGPCDSFQCTVRLIHSPDGLDVGSTLVVHCQTACVPCRLERCSWPTSGGSECKGRTVSLTLTPLKPLVVEPYGKEALKRHLGRVAIRSHKCIFGVGLIETVNETTKNRMLVDALVADL